MRKFRVRCKNKPGECTRFSVTAHVAETWEVDENADFVEVIATTDTIHRPSSTDQYWCIECDDEAVVEEYDACDCGRPHCPECSKVDPVIMNESRIFPPEK